MTDLVDPDKIEQIVGIKVPCGWHCARAVSAEQTVCILHSQGQGLGAAISVGPTTARPGPGIHGALVRSRGRGREVTITARARLIPVVAGMRFSNDRHRQAAPSRRGWQQRHIGTVGAAARHPDGALGDSPRADEIQGYLLGALRGLPACWRTWVWISARRRADADPFRAIGDTLLITIEDAEHKVAFPLELGRGGPCGDRADRADRHRG